MKLFCTIVSDVTKVDPLLELFLEAGIKGSTIVNATGMSTHLKANLDDIPLFSSLRNYLNNGKEEHALILTVLDDDLIIKASELVEEVLGDLSKPNTGICFALNLDFVKGVTHE